jgi:hypothetical protein
MGFNLKSGNSSSLKFKEMGATPAKMDASMLGGMMGGGDKGKDAIQPAKIQGAALWAQSSPAQMDASMLSGAADSGGGGFDLSEATTTDAEGMTENVDESKQSPADGDKPKEEKKEDKKKPGKSKGANFGPPPTIQGAAIRF